MASEKPAAKPAEAPAETEAAKKPGSKKLAFVAAAIMALEVLTVGVTMKMAGGPARAIADTPTSAPKEAAEKDVEVKLVEAKLPNSQGGPLYLYDLQVVAKVNEKVKDKVTALFADREAEIRDQIRTIIASSDRKSLAEPGLETLRRQIGYQLDQDLGKNLIKEVLIPKCTPYRTEY